MYRFPGNEYHQLLSLAIEAVRDSEFRLFLVFRVSGVRKKRWERRNEEEKELYEDDR